MLRSFSGLTLAQSAVDVMLAKAQVVSEGLVEPGSGADPVYNGSTLVTIALNDNDLDMPRDRESLLALMNQASRSLFLRIRLMRIARKEAERRAAPYLLRGMSATSDFRIEDKSLLVDIDIECPLADARGLAPGHHEA